MLIEGIIYRYNKVYIVGCLPMGVQTVVMIVPVSLFISWSMKRHTDSTPMKPASYIHLDRS